jgi:predicted amidohydrolase
LKIAAAQISCSLGDLEANLRKIDIFSARAKKAGADLIVFPEMADTGYAMPVIQERAASWSSGPVPQLQEIARAHSIAIVCGVSERDGASIYNSQVFVDQAGTILAKYRKTHLFAVASIDEHKCFSPGNSFTAFSFAGFRFGLSICYDLRFPEIYRHLAAEENVNAFIISSAWPFPRVEHLRALAVARAIENQSYVILANRVGADDGVSFCGSSAIIDPYGVVVASASTDREELLEAELSEDLVASVRSRMEIFAHRRRDLYK